MKTGWEWYTAKGGTRKQRPVAERDGLDWVEDAGKSNGGYWRRPRVRTRRADPGNAPTAPPATPPPPPPPPDPDQRSDAEVWANFWTGLLLLAGAALGGCIVARQLWLP